MAGAGPIMMEGQPPAWTTYVSVDDADATVAKVKKAGGTVFVEPMDVLDVGRMAVFADPTGAAAPSGSPGAQGRRPGQRTREPGLERAQHPGHLARPRLLHRRLRVGRQRPGRWATWCTPNGSSAGRPSAGMMTMPDRGAGRGAIALAGLLRHRRLRCHGRRRHRARGHGSWPAHGHPAGPLLGAPPIPAGAAFGVITMASHRIDQWGPDHSPARVESVRQPEAIEQKRQRWSPSCPDRGSQELERRRAARRRPRRQLGLPALRRPRRPGRSSSTSTATP